MRMVTFSDYNGCEVSVPLSHIQAVRAPSGRVNDFGDLLLTSGQRYGFNSDSTARRIIQEMMEDTQ
jgi:hypothetical protein